MRRISKTEAVVLLGSIVDPEWAAMWGDDADVAALRSLADSHDADARLLDVSHEQHQLLHDAGALRLVADLLET